MSNLLEKAKQYGKKKNSKMKYDKEQIEVALAWCKDEIGVSQAASVLGGSNGSNAYLKLAMILKQYIQQKEKQ